MNELRQKLRHYRDLLDFVKDPEIRDALRDLIRIAEESLGDPEREPLGLFAKWTIPTAPKQNRPQKGPVRIWKMRPRLSAAGS